MNNDEAVTYIIKEYGAQERIHAVDQFGRSPLWHAACAGSSASLRTLAENGALLDLPDDFGRTPLDAACLGGRTSAVKTLLELRAGLNCAAQPLGLTPCHYAALFGHSQCLALLIEHHANADAGTAQLGYFKPIHLAAANGWLQCVRELCAAGSDPDCASTHYILLDAAGTGVSLIARQTQSAEEIALLQGHSEIVQFFKNRKARQQKRPDEMTSIVQRKSSEQRESLMDLGTLQGDPTSLIPSISDDIVEVQTLKGL
jgi:ankyrin repeat protein